MFTKDLLLYDSWSDFRNELQRRSGIVVLNTLWHQVKPKSPLPWHEAQLKESIGLLSGRIMKLKKCPRCSGNLVLERDIDGLSKRCIQCSFEIAVITPPAPKPKYAGLSSLPPQTAALRHS